MYSNEHTLQDLLKKAYRSLDMNGTVDVMEVRNAYYKVVGDLIGRLTWSVRYDAGVLTVALASAALRQELSYRKEGLVNRINEVLGRPAVKVINLV